jgi:hypothetical protein
MAVESLDTVRLTFYDVDKGAEYQLEPYFIKLLKKASMLIIITSISPILQPKIPFAVDTHLLPHIVPVSPHSKLGVAKLGAHPHSRAGPTCTVIDFS